MREHVHLNLVRALLTDQQPLRTCWSSNHGAYLLPPDKRPRWLSVWRLLGEVNNPQDSVAGREEFQAGMQERRWQESTADWRAVGRE